MRLSDFFKCPSHGGWEWFGGVKNAFVKCLFIFNWSLYAVVSKRSSNQKPKGLRSDERAGHANGPALPILLSCCVLVFIENISHNIRRGPVVYK